ncbi:unnamed protein product (mitochondrion) [Plasmodiophora brassicae]|uniref:HECT domain-containing protein n=1 Tax=Plasmodiophora brassicae TaxID=37360 RepID=A0A3P3YGB7_PLABS|nr:unnamed protein product [Plasmodiophora brassicae]
MRPLCFAAIAALAVVGALGAEFTVVSDVEVVAAVREEIGGSVQEHPSETLFITMFETTNAQHQLVRIDAGSECRAIYRLSSAAVQRGSDNALAFEGTLIPFTKNDRLLHFDIGERGPDVFVEITFDDGFPVTDFLEPHAGVSPSSSLCEPCVKFAADIRRLIPDVAMENCLDESSTRECERIQENILLSYRGQTLRARHRPGLDQTAVLDWVTHMPDSPFAQCVQRKLCSSSATESADWFDDPSDIIDVDLEVRPHLTAINEFKGVMRQGNSSVELFMQVFVVHDTVMIRLEDPNDVSIRQYVRATQLERGSVSVEHGMSITLDRVLSGMSFPPSIAISQPQRTIVEQFEPVDIDLGTFDELPTRIADLLDPIEKDAGVSVPQYVPDIHCQACLGMLEEGTPVHCPVYFDSAVWKGLYLVDLADRIRLGWKRSVAIDRRRRWREWRSSEKSATWTCNKRWTFPLNRQTGDLLMSLLDDGDSSDLLREPFKIDIEGDAAVDEGGLLPDIVSGACDVLFSREYERLQHFVRDTKSDGIFVPSSASLSLVSSSQRSSMKRWLIQVGMLLGLSYRSFAHDDYRAVPLPLNIDLPLVTLQSLLSHSSASVGRDDIVVPATLWNAVFAPLLQSSCRSIAQYRENILAFDNGLDDTDIVTPLPVMGYEPFLVSKKRRRDANRDLTWPEIVAEYAKEVSKELLRTSWAFKALRRAFRSVLPDDMLYQEAPPEVVSETHRLMFAPRLVSWKDLASLLDPAPAKDGFPDVSILKSAVTSLSTVLQRHDRSPLLAKLLWFVTGSPRLQHQERISVTVNSINPDLLPRASTCSKTLEVPLPCATDADLLESRLLLVLEHFRPGHYHNVS